MNKPYKKKLKVALCFWGITRSLKYTIESIKKNIFEQLSKNNIEYNIFLHTYITDNPYSNPRANEENVILDKTEYRLLNPDYYKVENQDIVKHTLNIDKYKTKGNPWPDSETFINHLLALWSLKEVTALWMSRKAQYSNIIYCRPDLEYITPFNILWLYGEEDVIYTPNFHRRPTVLTNKKGAISINDRFAIGTPKTMKYYGNRFFEALDYSKRSLLESRLFLEHTLKKHNIKMEFINFLFIRVRATGKKNQSNVRRTRKILGTSRY
jgi:hypothetical protein